MKAYLLDRYKQDALRLGEISTPAVGDDDVLIEVHAAGLNLLDSKIRTGEFKAILPYKLPIALGHDFAGVVIRVGRNVRDFKQGDAVYSRVPDGRIGTLAEFIAVKAEDVAPKPANLTMVEAASIPLVGLTAWQALVERAGILLNGLKQDSPQSHLLSWRYRSGEHSRRLLSGAAYEPSNVSIGARSCPHGR